MQPRNMSPDRPGDDAARFLHELRELRDRAGLGPAELAARAHYPVDVLQAAEAGPALPDLPVLAAYVRGCGGTPAEWEERWRSLTRATESSASLPTRQGGTSVAAAAGARAGTTTAPPEEHDPDRIMAALSRDAAEPTRPVRKRTSGGAHRAPSVAHANGNSAAALGQQGSAPTPTSLPSSASPSSPSPSSASPSSASPSSPSLPAPSLPAPSSPARADLPSEAGLTSPAASSGSWFTASRAPKTAGIAATNPPADEAPQVAAQATPPAAPQVAPRTSPSSLTATGVAAAGSRPSAGHGDAGYGDRGYGDAGYGGSRPGSGGYANGGRGAATAAKSRGTAATVASAGAPPPAGTAPAGHQAAGRRALSREAAIALIVVAALAFIGILLAVLP